MRAPIEKIVEGAVLRSNDKRTFGKQVVIKRVGSEVHGVVFAAYQAGKRTAWVSSKDIYVDGHKIARGWGLVGS